MGVIGICYGGGLDIDLRADVGVFVLTAYRIYYMEIRIDCNLQIILVRSTILENTRSCYNTTSTNIYNVGFLLALSIQQFLSNSQFTM